MIVVVLITVPSPCQCLCVASAPFAPPLDVMPVEPSCKGCYEESSEDCLEMLVAFKKVWVASKRSSEHPSECLGPSLASSAPASAASYSAAPASSPSVPAAGSEPSNPSGSLPSSWSAASSQSLAHVRS